MCLYENIGCGYSNMEPVRRLLRFRGCCIGRETISLVTKSWFDPPPVPVTPSPPQTCASRKRFVEAVRSAETCFPVQPWRVLCKGELPRMQHRRPHRTRERGGLLREQNEWQPVALPKNLLLCGGSRFAIPAQLDLVIDKIRGLLF